MPGRFSLKLSLQVLQLQPSDALHSCHEMHHAFHWMVMMDVQPVLMMLL